MHSQQRKTGRRAIGRASRAAHLGICPPAETGAPLPASAPLRILVVEKDAALRRRAIERLAAADTSLVLGEAASVQEALENAATDSWDVIVLDARRPIQIAAQKNEALLEKLSLTGRGGLTIERLLKGSRNSQAQDVVFVPTVHFLRFYFDYTFLTMSFRVLNL